MGKAGRPVKKDNPSKDRERLRAQWRKASKKYYRKKKKERRKRRRGR